MESHLLQMRGLKPCGSCIICRKRKSHLLQMRGLKLKLKNSGNKKKCRIFYRCVD